MSNELIAKIAAEINKTGFPLELRVASVLRDRGYHVATNMYFKDQDEEKGREIDIRALKNAFFGQGRNAVRHCLLIECKKSSSRPWVFFTSPAVSYDQTVNRVLCLGVETGQWIRSMEEMAAMQKRHPWFRKPDRGRSFFEPFSSGGSEANQTIQKAILAAINASLDAHKSKFAGAYSWPNAIFYYPVVVLEGDLFTATLTKGAVTLRIADEVLVSVNYRSFEHPARREQHTVLVVREMAFKKALSALDKWLFHCAKRFGDRPNRFEWVSRKRSMRRRETHAKKSKNGATSARSISPLKSRMTN
jgi:hypothetical protein